MISKNDTLISIALLDNVYGKTLPITFLVCFDKSGGILKSEIIKYREPYGGAVKEESWLSQFTGKISKSNFSVGSEVQGISGATISANSVLKGINKLSLLVSHILEKHGH